MTGQRAPLVTRTVSERDAAPGPATGKRPTR